VARHLATDYEEGFLDRFIAFLRGGGEAPRSEPPPVPTDTPGENVSGLMAAMTSGVMPKGAGAR
jgi:hypothetical protein